MPAGALAGLCPACLLAQGVETERAETKARVRFEPPKLAELSRLFPQLQVLELLGAGGMGAVYKARQPALDRLVALKVLPAGGGVGSTERFNREARALARLSHPNIVGVHEFGQVEGLHFFIMEFVDGANLRQLEKAARMSPREALQIIPQICDALQYAHDEGVVHRDIKPENVLVDRKGRVKIADFGLAKIADPDPEATRLTVEGQVMGTPHYMAPEQVERPLAVDHRADIYALGVVFYEMLTGDLPLGKFAPPSRKVRLDVRLDDIVLRALENDPERRYQQASEVKQSVATVVDSPAETGTASEVAAAPEERQVRWLNIPVAVERNGGREIDFPGAMAAIFIVVGVAGVAHMFVRWVGGRELLSLVTLAWIVTVVFGINRAMNRPFSTERRIAVRRFALDALTLVGLVAFVVGSHGLVAWFDARQGGHGTVPAQVAVRNPDTGELAARLPGGGQIELLAVSGEGAGPNGWWLPDGRPLIGTTFIASNIGHVADGGATTNLDFIFHLTDPPTGTEAAYIEFDDSDAQTSGGGILRDGQPLDGAWGIRAAFLVDRTMTTARAALGLEPWQVIARHSPALQSSSQMKQAGRPHWNISFQHSANADGHARLVVQFGPWDKQWQVRVVAVDQTGGLHTKANWTSNPAGENHSRTFVFAGLPLDEVREFRMEARPVHVVEFRNLALRPAASAVAQEPTTRSSGTMSQRAVKIAATGTLAVTLANGTTVELLALAHATAEPFQWWRPDGTPHPNAIFDIQGPAGMLGNDRPRTKLAFKVTGSTGAMETASYEFEPSAGISAGGEVWQNGGKVTGGWPVVAAWAHVTNQATLRFGLRFDNWRNVAVFMPNKPSRTETSTVSGDPKWITKLNHYSDDGSNTLVTAILSRETRQWRMRMVAVDMDGREHFYSRANSTPEEHTETWTYTFPNLTVDRIRQFNVQVQPVHWVEFRNVPLQPATPVPAISPLRLGEVVERSFDELLDLDTGRIAAFPPGKAGENPLAAIGENVLWAQANGFDVLAGAGKLGVLNLDLVKLEDSDWDALSPELIMNRLSRGIPYHGRHLELRAGEYPVNFAFRTREKGVGILQLVPVSDAGAGTKVRYRLALAPGTDGHE